MRVCGRRTTRGRLLRRSWKAQLARYLADRLGETDGAGGGGVSTRVPGVRLTSCPRSTFMASDRGRTHSHDREARPPNSERLCADARKTSLQRQGGRFGRALPGLRRTAHATHEPLPRLETLEKVRLVGQPFVGRVSNALQFSAALTSRQWDTPRRAARPWSRRSIRS